MGDTIRYAVDGRGNAVFTKGDPMSNEKSVLARVLEEVRAAEAHAAQTTAHNVYVSGVFEDAAPASVPPKSVLAKVLDEVRAAESHAAATTAHNTYVSGVFEQVEGN